MADQQVLAAATDRVLAWVSLETSRESRHWLPWRPNYDVGESSIEDCEDPDRVVVFDDLSGGLFSIDTVQDRFCLLCRFLDFLDKCLMSAGLEKPTFTEERSTDFNLWWKVGEAYPDADSLLAFSEVHLAQSELDRICTFVENVYKHAVGLFDGNLRTALTLRYMHFKSTTVLSRNNSSDRRHRKHAEKDVRQFFKSLLKQEHNRDNLAVWEQYARFEWEIGNYDDSRKVFETALAMAGSALNAENSEFLVIRLYGTYSRLELGVETTSTSGICSNSKKLVSCGDQQVRTERALRILVMAVNGYQANSHRADVSPTDVVRARHFYQSRLDDMHATFADMSPSDAEKIKRSGRCLLDWTVCFAWFQLLTIGLQSASSVLQNFQTSLRKLTEISATPVDADSNGQKIVANSSTMLENSNVSAYHELLQTAAIRRVQLTQFHSNDNLAPLNVVRTALLGALAEFPDNVWFLKSFIDVELRSHISGRMREYFHWSVLEANTPLPVLYAILAERKRLLRLSADSQLPCKSDVMFMVDLFN